MRIGDMTRKAVSRRGFLQTAALGGAVAVAGSQVAAGEDVPDALEGGREPRTEAEHLFLRHAGEFGGSK